LQEALERLFQLQQVDTALAEAQKALRELDDGTHAAQELATAEEELAARQKALAEQETTLRHKELELKSTEQKLAANRERAYGGKVSNPRELQGMEMEIEALGRTKGDLEEEILILYDDIEVQGAAVGEQEQLVARLRQEHQRIQETFEQSSRELAEEIQRLQAERDELAAGVDSSLLARYDRIRERHGNLAIVAVADGVCTGCNTSVPSTTMNSLKTTGGEQTCDNCRRLLYLPSK